jgi:hypothetical protein
MTFFTRVFRRWVSQNIFSTCLYTAELLPGTFTTWVAHAGNGILGCRISMRRMPSFLLRRSARLIRCARIAILLRKHDDRAYFGQYLEEDPRTNRIDDSLQLFTAICSNQLLKNIHLVLFLSKSGSHWTLVLLYSRHADKTDVLQSKLANGVRVSK